MLMLIVMVAVQLNSAAHRIDPDDVVVEAPDEVESAARKQKRGE